MVYYDLAIGLAAALAALTAAVLCAARPLSAAPSLVGLLACLGVVYPAVTIGVGDTGGNVILALMLLGAGFFALVNARTGLALLGAGFVAIGIARGVGVYGHPARPDWWPYVVMLSHSMIGATIFLICRTPERA